MPERFAQGGQADSPLLIQKKGTTQFVLQLAHGFGEGLAGDEESLGGPAVI